MTRTVLFLQGPASPVMARVAAEVTARGHRARRLNLCLGDAVFWRLPGADVYRGGAGRWPAFVDAYMERHGVTDLAAFADCRAPQAAAIEVAQRRGVRVHAVEHGYLRPDWVTVEPDGMSSYSRFPRDPDAILALAAGRPSPEAAPIARSSFLAYALYDLAYNLPNVFLGWATHPGYRHHAMVHPLVEYGAWLWKFARAGAERRRTTRLLPQALAPGGPLFLMPLQLAGDYQIRVHSPFPHLLDAVEWIVASFAENAPADARLLFKVHPLDNGLGQWPRRIGAMAARAGVADRMAVVDGGDLEAMVAAAAGVVTVNSTVGLSAIRAGRPLAVLGNAVFDVPGLADQRPLAMFFRGPEPPDPALADAFLRALAHATQVRGGFVAPQAIAVAAREIAARILEDEPRLAAPGRRRGEPVTFRRQAEFEEARKPR